MKYNKLWETLEALSKLEPKSEVVPTDLTEQTLIAAYRVMDAFADINNGPLKEKSKMTPDDTNIPWYWNQEKGKIMLGPEPIRLHCTFCNKYVERGTMLLGLCEDCVIILKGRKYMTSPNLTKGFRLATIRTLSRILSDVKSFRDDFDPEQLEAMRQTAMKIVEVTSMRDNDVPRLEEDGTLNVDTSDDQREETDIRKDQEEEDQGSMYSLVREQE